MNEVNIPLLRKAVEWAEVEAGKPSGSLWIQQMWTCPPDTQDSYLRGLRQRNGLDATCGTAYCIAGYVCHVQDVGSDGSIVVHGDDAARELGIEYDEEDHSSPGMRLFNANNSIKDVRRIAEEIAGERL